MTTSSPGLLRRWRRRLMPCLFLPLSALAGTQSDPLGLTEAIALAEQQSPELQARRAAREAAELQVGPAAELPDPELIVAVENVPADGADAGNLTADFMTMRRIGWMQAFPRRAKREARSALADADAAVRRAEYRVEQLAVRESAADAWIVSSIAEQRRRQLDTIEPLLDALVATADAALATGRGSVADALNARLQRSALTDRRSEATLQVRIARAELERWLPELGDRPMATEPDYASLDTGATNAADAVHRHRGLLTLAAEERQVDAALALAEAEKKLDWALEVSYADRGPAYLDMLSVGVRIGLPIRSGQRQDPLIASRQADRQQFLAGRTSMLRAHTATVRALIAHWESAVERVQHYQSRLLPLARDRADAALSAYRGGRGSLAEALIAMNDLIEQELALLDRRLELGLAWAELQFSFAEEV